MPLLPKPQRAHLPHARQNTVEAGCAARMHHPRSTCCSSTSSTRSSSARRRSPSRRGSSTTARSSPSLIWTRAALSSGFHRPWHMSRPTNPNQPLEPHPPEPPRACARFDEPSRCVAGQSTPDRLRTGQVLPRSERIHSRDLLSREPDGNHLHRLGTPTGAPPAAALEFLDVIPGLGLIGPCLDLLFKEQSPCQRTDRGTGVEVAGIEPASSRDEPGLLRAQPNLSAFSVPAIFVGTLQTDPASVESRVAPDTQATQQAF